MWGETWVQPASVTLKLLKQTGFFANDGGGRGIRTLGGGRPPQRFSRPPRSTAPASLRGRRGGSYVGRRGGRRKAGSEGVVAEDGLDAAAPLALEALELLLGRGAAGGGDLLEAEEVAGLVAAVPVDAGAALEAALGDGHDVAGDVAHGAAAEGGGERGLRHLAAECPDLLGGPAADQLGGGVERGVVVEEAGPERGQRAQAAPGAGVGAPHLEVALEPDLGEGGRQVVDPVGDGRALAREGGQAALQEGAEGLAGAVDV